MAITTEAQYQDAMNEIADLQKQYRNLNPNDRNKPYIGQQMARDIYKLTSEAKLFEYDRFEKRFEPGTAGS